VKNTRKSAEEGRTFAVETFVHSQVKFILSQHS